VGTKFFNSKVCVEKLFGKEVTVEHLLLSFLGDFFLSELIFSAMQIPVLEHVQKQENRVTLNGLANLSLCFASNLCKGTIPAIATACAYLVFLSDDTTCIELQKDITFHLLSKFCWHRYSSSAVVFLMFRFGLVLKIR